MGLIRQFVFDSLARVSFVVSFVGYGSIAAMGKRVRCKTTTMGQGTPRESEWAALSPIDELSDGMVDDASVASVDEHFSEFGDLRDDEPEEEVISYMKLCS